MLYNLLVQVFAAALPHHARLVILRKLLGWKIADSALISRLCLLNVRMLNMAERSKIGALTYAKGLDLIELGESASIGRLNWITGFPTGDARHFSHVEDRRAELILERHSALTNRHLIDCTDSVRICEYATFAGFGSQILTHSIDLRSSRQSCKPVLIGRFSFVGTRVVMLGGSSVPDYSVVAAGSVVNKSLKEPRTLYGGVPAVAVKPLEGLEYWVRSEGGVR